MPSSLSLRAAVFLSTPSARRATAGCKLLVCWCHDFYPRPPRGGRHHRVCAGQLVVQISIHALREEDDTVCLIVLGIAFDFYPRPPRGGRRLYTCEVIGEPKFLSTPSARRATDNSASFLPGEGFLSTPSARRATFTKASSILTELISIHALREEGDLPQNCQAEQRRYFYPRPPRGGRPPIRWQRRSVISISIHALREEGDLLHECRVK